MNRRWIYLDAILANLQIAMGAPASRQPPTALGRAMPLRRCTLSSPVNYLLSSPSREARPSRTSPDSRSDGVSPASSSRILSESLRTVQAAGVRDGVGQWVQRGSGAYAEA